MNCLLTDFKTAWKRVVTKVSLPISAFAEPEEQKYGTNSLVADLRWARLHQTASKIRT